MTPTASHSSPSKTRPNILILFTDQHQAAVLGAEGHPDVQTPNLDRLASAGARFSRAYCQDSICVASRASLFSGLYPRTLGCRGNAERSSVMENAVSLPTLFRSGGYRTAAFGKRHLHGGCDKGWDIRLSHFRDESDGESYVDWIQSRGLADALDRDWSAEWGRGMEGTDRQEKTMDTALFSVRPSDLPADATMEAWTKQKTVEFIRTASEQPFFCFSSFYRPHQPYTPLPVYFDRFDRSHWGQGRNAGDGLAMPASLRQPVEELPPALQEQSRGSNRVWRMDLARKDEQLFREYLAAYYALVEEIDDHVGDILDALEETGQLENTIIVYASDHGDFVGAHGMAEKCSHGQNVYEETIRIPLFVTWQSQLPAGRRIDSLTGLLDLYPTLLDLADLPKPQHNPAPQGHSLAPLLRGGPYVPREYLISENWSQSTVVSERYKLGIWTEPELPNYADYRGFGDLLFDRANDPWELTNLAGREELAETEARLRTCFQEWKNNTPTTLPDLPSASGTV